MIIFMFSYHSFRLVLIPIIELLFVFLSFITWYRLRSMTDGIPFVHLRIPYISPEQFLPFIILGCILWGVIMWSYWLYNIRSNTPLFEEIRKVVKYSTLWFVVYISFVYLTTGFLFSKEIPRLIIFYVYFLSTFFSILGRIFFHHITSYLRKIGNIKKETLLILWNEEWKEPLSLEKNEYTYIFYDLDNISPITELIRLWKINGVLNMTEDVHSNKMRDIIKLTRIYGIPFLYPKYLPSVQRDLWKESFILWIPCIEVSSLSISFWEIILKRVFDILIWVSSIIIFSPIFIIISIAIKIEDPSGPIIFKNRRIGKNGKIFDLYKFRYMYWKYSIKDAYWVKKDYDDALKYEEELRQLHDSRKWPLYKIQNDPRIMKMWRIIERLSLDELPQLFNVLIGNMSLIGPRPHQPREVEHYSEEDKQVLIISPGITGMAQVYGRENNSFEKEVSLDRYYIENYSFLLDILIFIRTFFVILGRIWQKPLAKTEK